jgi:hypothetical protein
MTAKTAAKRKTSPAKSVAATSKPVMAKLVPAKDEKKHRKDKKANGKSEAKMKVVRDSFTMPQNDYAKIGELKRTCLKAGMQVKKSELLRAGLHALGKLSAAQLQQTITQMEQIKAGRPKKSGSNVLRKGEVHLC